MIYPSLAVSDGKVGVLGARVWAGEKCLNVTQIKIAVVVDRKLGSRLPRCLLKICLRRVFSDSSRSVGNTNSFYFID